VNSGFFHDVKRALGDRGQLVTFGSDGAEYYALLYDAFPVRIWFERDARRFGVELAELPAGEASRLRAEVAAIDADPSALPRLLAVVDGYARAALPEKYLRRYDAAYQVGPLRVG
jgi:hypothetical protein